MVECSGVWKPTCSVCHKTTIKHIASILEVSNDYYSDVTYWIEFRSSVLASSGFCSFGFNRFRCISLCLSFALMFGFHFLDLGLLRCVSFLYRYLWALLLFCWLVSSFIRLATEFGTQACLSRCWRELWVFFCFLGCYSFSFLLDWLDHRFNHWKSWSNSLCCMRAHCFVWEVLVTYMCDVSLSFLPECLS